MQSLNIQPIGYLKSKDQAKFSVPHQASKKESKGHYIELLGSQNFEMALKDLDGFERIWLLWWFDKNTSWRPCVLPPRGESKKRGVFATRSPHRPNPLGISCVKILKIKGRKIFISDSDLIDGTPIFDIKPYIPEVDSFPDSKAGWVDSLNLDHSKNYQVIISNQAQEQLDWLMNNWAINFVDKASETLAKDPSPHRTRRISKLKDGSFRIGCGPWRLFFTLNQNEILISKVAPGYPSKSLLNKDNTNIIDKAAQLEFLKLWA
jgi:tRNA-Thr(GGU) m(6)t(6)A37 methyltransferase TsaA